MSVSLKAMGVPQAMTHDQVSQRSEGTSLVERLRPRELTVKQVRNQLGVGGLIERAQGSIQVIRNTRTRSSAIVMSQALLRHVLDGQVRPIATQLARSVEAAGAQHHERRAERSRASLLAMLETMEPLTGDVPIVDAGPSTPDVPV